MKIQNLIITIDLLFLRFASLKFLVLFKMALGNVLLWCFGVCGSVKMRKSGRISSSHCVVQLIVLWTFFTIGRRWSTQNLAVALLQRKKSNGGAANWIIPEGKSVKCNIDVALFGDGKFGFGLYIRNADGALVKARSGWVHRHSTTTGGRGVGSTSSNKLVTIIECPNSHHQARL